jgi:hypothetical protein
VWRVRWLLRWVATYAAMIHLGLRLEERYQIKNINADLLRCIEKIAINGL